MQDSIQRKIKLAASVERVWRAISTAEEFADWFGATVSGEFVPGAQLDCASTHPDHLDDRWVMTIIEVTAPRRLVYTWPAYYGPDSDRDGETDPHLTVCFEIVEHADGCELIITETGFAALPNDYAPTAYRMNSSGWDEQIENIGAHLER